VHSTAVTVQRKLKIRKRKRKRYVFSLDLNVDSVVDDVTSGGREFHVRDAAARKARSPIVQRHVEGTATANDDAEQRRRRPGRSVTGCRTSAKWAGTSPCKKGSV